MDERNPAGSPDLAALPVPSGCQRAGAQTPVAPSARGVRRRGPRPAASVLAGGGWSAGRGGRDRRVPAHLVPAGSRVGVRAGLGLGSTERPLRLPNLMQGEHDRRAFTTPTRNAFAAAIGGGGGQPDAIDLLASLDAHLTDRARVVYLLRRCLGATRSTLTPSGSCSDDTYAFNDRRSGWLALREILTRLARDPAGHASADPRPPPGYRPIPGSA